MRQNAARRTAIAILLFSALTAMTARAASQPNTWDGELRTYSGATGEDLNDEDTWTVVTTSHITTYFVLDDYPGCETELTAPELCPDDERAWYQTQAENAQAYSQYTCNPMNCADKLQAACENANAQAWYSSGAYLFESVGTAHCASGTFRPRGENSFFGTGCSCQCEGTHLSGAQRLVLRTCSFGSWE